MDISDQDANLERTYSGNISFRQRHGPFLLASLIAEKRFIVRTRKARNMWKGRKTLFISYFADSSERRGGSY